MQDLTEKIMHKKLPKGGTRVFNPMLDTKVHFWDRGLHHFSHYHHGTWRHVWILHRP